MGGFFLAVSMTGAAGLLGAIGSAASITSLAISPQAVTAIGESWVALMRVLFG